MGKPSGPTTDQTIKQIRKADLRTGPTALRRSHPHFSSPTHRFGKDEHFEGTLAASGPVALTRVAIGGLAATVNFASVPSRALRT